MTKCCEHDPDIDLAALKCEFADSPYFTRALELMPLTHDRVQNLRELHIATVKYHKRFEQVRQGLATPFFVIENWEAQYDEDPEMFSVMYALTMQVHNNTVRIMALTQSDFLKSLSGQEVHCGGASGPVLSSRLLH